MYVARETAESLCFVRGVPMTLFITTIVRCSFFFDWIGWKANSKFMQFVELRRYYAEGECTVGALTKYSN